MATLMLEGDLPKWGEERGSSEELGEKQGAEAPLRVLQQHELAGWQGRAKRDLIWVGFVENGQIVEP